MPASGIACKESGLFKQKSSQKRQKTWFPYPSASLMTLFHGGLEDQLGVFSVEGREYSSCLLE